MMPMLQNADLSLDDWADILEYSPLPSSFADKVRDKAKQAREQGPDPMQQQMMALEVQERQSEIAENLANAQFDQIRAAREAQETQLAPLNTLADLMQPFPATGIPQ